MDNLPSLPLPVVGDRVEVLWRGELCAAEVVKCHRTGEYNVVYENDGTVRTFVTREEHRLLPLAENYTFRSADTHHPSPPPNPLQ